MNYFVRAWHLFDNYLLARWQNRPSTAYFWYLPEPPTIHTDLDLEHYQQANTSPLYLIDYREKLKYPLSNEDGIIVLPYGNTIGHQVNPEAAFQYALGLHDQYIHSGNPFHLEQFWHYADYFQKKQSPDGRWAYAFDWYGSQAPWYSALAQSRGAAVMLRAWLLKQDQKYLDAATNALSGFATSTAAGGFLHTFEPSQTAYFEEYPQTPTGVINGFMASLISIWEVGYWTQIDWLKNLWSQGIQSLDAMLPFYSTGWWSLYDLDDKTPIANVNSPRYHLLEMNYLQVLGILSQSPVIQAEHQIRSQQYTNRLARSRAFSMKCMRKLLYK